MRLMQFCDREFSIRSGVATSSADFARTNSSVPLQCEFLTISADRCTNGLTPSSNILPKSMGHAAAEQGSQAGGGSGVEH
jgi:hypothetical protein